MIGYIFEEFRVADYFLSILWYGLGRIVGW